MITFLLSVAIVLFFVALIAHYTARFGSSDVVDRDAQRADFELSAILSRAQQRHG